MPHGLSTMDGDAVDPCTRAWLELLRQDGGAFRITANGTEVVRGTCFETLGGAIDDLCTASATWLKRRARDEIGGWVNATSSERKTDGRAALQNGESHHSALLLDGAPKFIMGGSEEDKFDHPTQKPVALMRRPVTNHTKRGEMVYEPFLGSGTTLMAAETTGRVCCGLELDPKYVDVIIGRWQQVTGKQARLEGQNTTFAEVEAHRGCGAGAGRQQAVQSASATALPAKQRKRNR